MGPTQRRFQQRIQERENELQELRKAVETLKVRTDHIRQQQITVMLPSLHDTDHHRKTWFGRIYPWSFDQEEPVTPE